VDLSVIIVSWNTRDVLRKCLSSVEAHKGSLAVQTIVVDNDSVDGTCEMIKSSFPGVHLVKSGGNLGFARGCNLGFREAVAPVVLFLNPDTEVIGEALTKMVAFLSAQASVGALNCMFREPSGDAFGPGLQWFPSPLTELAVLLLVSKGTQGKLSRFVPYQSPETSGYVQKLYGGCLLVRRSVLEQVGTFDERFFMYCEDVDLSRRILNAGWRLYYLAEAEIHHQGGGASSRTPGRFSVLMTCESFSRLMRKHYGFLGSFGYRAVALFGGLFRLCVLSFLRILSVLGLHRSGEEAAASSRKYSTMIQWALGLQKAFIPARPTGSLSGVTQHPACDTPGISRTTAELVDSGRSGVDAG
jgi:GT2 family glycosyltransferase